MRYGPQDKFWMVTDPVPDATLADVCFETSLAGFERQLRGGLSMASNPTLFTDRAEAEAEAHLRLVATRAAAAIAHAAPAEAMRGAARVAVLDGDGKVLFEAELGSLAVERGAGRKGVAPCR